MGCMFCGREIGPLRLLRDSEFCTSRHRSQYKDRLSKALGRADLTELRSAVIAEFVTRLSPTIQPAQPRPDLSPLDWTDYNQAAEPPFPMAIGPILGRRAKRIPTRAADRPFVPHLADQDPGPPGPRSFGRLTQAMPVIPDPAIAGQTNGNCALDIEPAGGKPVAARELFHPPGAARTTFSASETRLRVCLSLKPAAALALDPAPGGRAQLLPLQAPDRRCELRRSDGLTAPGHAPVAAQTALPTIPHPSVAAQTRWGEGTASEAAKGHRLPAGLAQPYFSASTPRLPGLLQRKQKVVPGLSEGAAVAKLPYLQAADRQSALCEPDLTTPPVQARLTAPALPGVPPPAIAARTTCSQVETELALHDSLPACIEQPSFSASRLPLPRFVVRKSRAPLSLDRAVACPRFLSVQAANRRPAPSGACFSLAPMPDQTSCFEGTESEPAQGNRIPARLVRPAVFPAIAGPSMPAQTSWLEDFESEPAPGGRIPARLAQPSFSRPTPRFAPFVMRKSTASPAAQPTRWGETTEAKPSQGDAVPVRIAQPSSSGPALFLPTFIPWKCNTPLSLDAVAGSEARPLSIKAANRAVAPSTADQEIVWASQAAPRLPACITPKSNAPLALPPVMAPAIAEAQDLSRQRALQLAGHRAVPSMELTAAARPITPELPRIADPSVAFEMNWSNGIEAEPALSQLVPYAPQFLFPIFAAKIPFRLDLEPIQDTEAGREPPREADVVPLEYYCARLTSSPAAAIDWDWGSSFCALPALRLQPTGEKLETIAIVKPPRTSFFPAVKWKMTPREQRTMGLAAAGVMLAILSGFGLRFAARIGTETPDVKRDAAALSAGAGKSSGPLGKVRRAIAARAAVELSDAFRGGMAAWGQASAWAPGWIHHPEGYVQTGQLAFFEPSMRFTDYRMEFFGQIESKSIDWVVRAQDRKNYYAMKFTVIHSGLRPIIAMVHYAVTNGRAGRPIETPLMNVMVHNNTPYHVSVAVKGDRIVTSIEGQEVDRWIDGQIPAGGVGFYSDAGERARLYWMKVSKNEDFLGKVCAYLSGSTDASRTLALSLPTNLLSQSWDLSWKNHGNRKLNTNSEGR